MERPEMNTAAELTATLQEYHAEKGRIDPADIRYKIYARKSTDEKEMSKKGAAKAEFLRRMVICGECGKTMVGGINGKKYFYFRCDTETCARRPRGVRAQIIVDEILKFLDTKPFSTPEVYTHYEKEMKKVGKLVLEGTKKELAGLQTKAKHLNERLERAKEILTSTEEEVIKEEYRGDIVRIRGEIDEVETLAGANKEQIADGKAAILTYEIP